jgi:hypothetical protein
MKAHLLILVHKKAAEPYLRLDLLQKSVTSLCPEDPKNTPEEKNCWGIVVMFVAVNPYRIWADGSDEYGGLPLQRVSWLVLVARLVAALHLGG